MSAGGVDSDEQQIRAGCCPVCHRKIGTQQSRHSVIVHLNRARDLEHVTWRTAHYREHFRHGKSRKPPPQVQKEAVMRMLAEHLGEQMVTELFSE